jgi:hypothetical protein
MAKQTRNFVPSQMLVAERSVDQARKAFENLLANAQATANKIERGAGLRVGAKDISTKAITYAEKNVQTSLDYAQSLLQAKDLTEVMRLHSEYVQGQMRLLAEQASMMGQMVSVASMGAARTKARTTHRQDADLEDALVAARERGRARVTDILKGEDMLSADAFAERLGTTRVTVNTKRKQRQVLALEGAKRGFRFPRWQVGSNGKPFAVIPDLFDRLGGDAWAVYRFLVQHHPELDGLTGREALRRGKSKEVVEVAESVARAFA